METQVIVVGAGPVGLMLACELRLGGADVLVLERRTVPSSESRASTLHARTMEIFASRGLDLGSPPREPRGHFAGIPLDLSLPSSYAGQWKVPQTRTVEVLTARASSLGARVLRGYELCALWSGDDFVECDVIGPSGTDRVIGRYLVACDGQDSTVRRLLRADLIGVPAQRELLRADVTDVDIPNRRFERLPHGLAIAARTGDGVTRVMVHAFGARPRPGSPDFADVVTTWKRVTGEDLSGAKPLWVNAFTDANEQLGRYRCGQVLFAGDAAHRQLPVGGQALNLGLQDAVNLGWKLARQVGPFPDEGLLDTYHAERHAVGARVLANIRTQAALLLGDPSVEPVRELLAELVGVEDVRARLAGMVSGLDIRYGGGDHPLVGGWWPGDVTPLRSGRGLVLTGTVALAAPWADRVTAMGLPSDEGESVLVRPDGHVAWVGGNPREALRRWFGPPSNNY